MSSETLNSSLVEDTRDSLRDKPKLNDFVKKKQLKNEHIFGLSFKFVAVK